MKEDNPGQSNIKGDNSREIFVWDGGYLLFWYKLLRMTKEVILTAGALVLLVLVSFVYFWVPKSKWGEGEIFQTLGYVELFVFHR